MSPTMQQLLDAEKDAAFNLACRLLEFRKSTVLEVPEEVIEALAQFELASDARATAVREQRRPAYDLDDPALIDPAHAAEPECCS